MHVNKLYLHKALFLEKNWGYPFYFIFIFFKSWKQPIKLVGKWFGDYFHSLTFFAVLGDGAQGLSASLLEPWFRHS